MVLTFADDRTATLKTTEAKNLLNYASKKRLEGRFNDVSIVAGNENIPANKLVLSCFSVVFEQMFNTEMRERYEHSVDMNNFERDSVKDTIKFMYTGILDIDNENVLDILEFAHYLQIDEIVKFCCKFLEPAIDIHNCFEIFGIASLYESASLLESVKVFIENNLDGIISAEGFGMLSKENLVDCIVTPGQKGVQAEKMCNAVIAWIKHDRDNRKQELSDLFQKINFDIFSVNFLMATASTEELISENPVTSRLFFQAITRGKSLEEKDATKLISFGGHFTLKDVFEVFSCVKRPATIYDKLPVPLYGHCCVKLFDEVYCIGGCAQKNNQGYKPCSDVWKLNISTNNPVWEKTLPMQVERVVMSAAVFNNSIVVAGGTCGEEESVSTAEVFISAINEWKFIAPMKQSRSGHALVTCQKKLYSLGGCATGVKSLKSVECLSGLNERWKSVKPMQKPRRWFSAVDCNNCIYAIGGRSGVNDDSRLKSVEKFDPATGKWSFVSDMNTARSAHSAAVMDGKIYVVGGVDTNSIAVRDIDCYDPTTDKWCCVGTTDKALDGHAVIAAKHV